jgi:cysteine desulfurase
MNGIYLDYNGTTPIDPRVASAMRPLLEDMQGNPSSAHAAGQLAREVIERARGQIASLLGAFPDEIIFTSGGTEADNLALKGVFYANRHRGSHIVTTAVEHPAVLGSARFLEQLGAHVTIVGVDRYGRVDPADIERAITAETILVSVMQANNEVGSIQPIADISRVAHDRGVLVHSDAAQAIGKIPCRVGMLGVDLLTVAGHKFYAPKGVGALYLRRGVAIEPLLHGGGQERGWRSGTESALLTAALGSASDLAADLDPMVEVRRLRDLLWTLLRTSLGDRVALNGHPDERLPNTLNVSFAGVVGSELLAQLDWVAASTGSACHADNVELSPVLEAMRVDPHFGMGAVRFSLGRPTTEHEIRTVAGALLETVPKLAGVRLAS